MDFLMSHISILMFVVLAALFFSGFPVGFVLGGVTIWFGMLGWALDMFSPTEFFNFMYRIWGGAADNIVLIGAPLFIFMGILLEKSQIAADLLRCLQILLRRVPGGLALGVAIMGTIMAATTGIIGASVVMLSMLALPAMLKQKYDTGLATGIVSASGTLGILIPPSIMLVIMGDMMQISTGKLFLGAVLPGLMLSAFYVIYIIVLAWLKPHLAPPLTDDEWQSDGESLTRLVLRAFVPPTVLIGLVLGSIFMGWATPTEAAGVGAAGAIVLTIFSGRFSVPLMSDAVRTSALTIGMVFLIIIAAACFSYVFRSLGGDDVIHEMLDSAGLGPWGVLALLLVGVFLLGFFFDWLEIILIVVPIFAPIIAGLDFGDHLPGKVEAIYWFAILIAINLQTSFLTPPFGFALFFVKGAAPPSVRMEQIYKGIIPFVVLQVLALIIVVIYPDVALWLPRTLLGN
ncbi:TRAP transporter large permease subunit [Bordetella sp. 15P40C-2]|nr:TRAP transporter large permease subunit [Bordetella sp. 15P40C-2]